MAMAGYSGKALLKKLGIKPGMKILVMHSPENYEQLLNWPINGQFSVRGEIPDLIHLLAKDMNCFLSGMKKILPLCKKNTSVAIWVSWYKKSSGDRKSVV